MANQNQQRTLGADWNRCFELTGWVPKFSRICQNYMLCKAPRFLRVEDTASFCIYPDGPARDFGTGNSYTPFQIYLCFLGLDPHLPVNDPRRVEAARKFWPEKYGRRRSFVQSRSERNAQQIQAALSNQALQTEASPRNKNQFDLELLQRRTAALNKIRFPLGQSEQSLALPEFALKRGFDLRLLLNRKQQDVIGVQSVALLKRNLEEQYGKEETCQILCDAGLFVHRGNEQRARFFGPSVFFLVTTFVPGQELLVADVRLRQLENSSIKELGVPGRAGSEQFAKAPPALFGLDKALAICRYARTFVFLAESPCDALALEELFFIYKKHRESSIAESVSLWRRVAFLGLCGTSSFRPEHIHVFQNAAQLILAFDNDEAGRSCAEKVKREAEKLAMPVTSIKDFRNGNQSFKDPNDLLKFQKESPAMNCWAPVEFQLLFKDEYYEKRCF